MNRIVLTGATGNTGSRVLAGLRAAFPTLPILALTRPGSAASPPPADGVTTCSADLTNVPAVSRLFARGDVLVEIANIRVARTVLPAFEEAGGQRAFCVTTTGVFSTHQEYGTLYKTIEDEMRSSGVEVTILRPSMIYGNERDHNMHKLLRVLDRTPAIPVFGANALMQPVHVDDLADGIVRAVIADAHGEFNLAGPEPLAYQGVLRSAMAALGRRVALVPVPAWLALGAAAVGSVIPGFPVSVEQVRRLQEDKVFDISAAQSALGYSPRPFSEGIRAEVLQLRALGLIRG